jgi:hypothetical protein
VPEGLGATDPLPAATPDVNGAFFLTGGAKPRENAQLEASIMKKLFVLCALSALAVACGGGDKPADNPSTTTSTTTTSTPASSSAPATSAAPAGSAAPAPMK